MRRRILATLATVVLALAVVAATRAGSLTAKQQEVLDYLVANWGQDTAVTGIDLAMEILGGDYTLEDRYALGDYIREHPEVHRVIRIFGWETVSLTPTEKLIARHLSSAEREQRPAPSLAELAPAVQVSPEAITAGLATLERFGIIHPDGLAGGVGYRMAKPRYVNWEGGMRITFMYHRVNVQGVKKLDTY
ncbi:hypothetical protein MYX77_01755 [Acidobacteriia bacterium AH_259_A11_L15]|nr:hypothetical protein [Acidobacteriia bacterium AH_259_A11_L15]